MNCDKIIDIASNVLNDKKALNISALHIGELTVIAEYFILATATSNTHVKALADAVEEKLKSEGISPDHIEGKATGWILMDYGDIIVNLFTKEQRERYSIEKVWGDCQFIDVEE